MVQRQPDFLPPPEAGDQHLDGVAAKMPAPGTLKFYVAAVIA
jgi:hypothetical protein